MAKYYIILFDHAVSSNGCLCLSAMLETSVLLECLS